MQTIEGQDRSGSDVAAQHPLTRALAARAVFWRQPEIDQGDLTPDFQTAAALVRDAAAIEALLDHQASFSGGLDLKGRAAMMITDYSYLFAATTVPLFVGARLMPDLSAGRYALRFDRRETVFKGRTVEELRPHVRFLSTGFTSDDAGHASHPDATIIAGRDSFRDHFRVGIEAHFRPFVDVLHARSGLSRSALWRLVTDSVAALFLDAGQRFRCLDEALADTAAILKHEGSPLTNRQMHYFEISLRDDRDPETILLTRTFRARGGCCRYYTADGGKLCSTCVLKGQAERDRDIEDAMRRRLGSTAMPQA